MNLDWPQGLRPGETPVYTSNELHTPVEPQAIWKSLIRATHWRQFYGNAKRMRFLNDHGPDLTARTRFSWVTFGVRVTCEIREFEPYRKLAWYGEALGSSGYHGWLLKPDASGGTFIITEETQKGIVPGLGKRLLEAGLLKQHQLWLEGLEKQSLKYWAK